MLATGWERAHRRPRASVTRPRVQSSYRSHVTIHAAVSPRRPSTAKQHGVHYTPSSLARAVAARLAAAVTSAGRAGSPIVLADPACGEGNLLEALADALRAGGVDAPLELHALDRDPSAVAAAAARLSARSDRSRTSVRASSVDFLASCATEGELALDGPAVLPAVDLVIANPPYVRTQVLGAAAARALAVRFGLDGRVDLAYPFAMAMIEALAPGGHFALILSNKFLTIRSGQALRQFFQAETEMLEVWDLGDSRLFGAAVLPAVVFGRRMPGAFRPGVPFRSVYELPGGIAAATVHTAEDFLACYASAATGTTVAWGRCCWNVRSGRLGTKSASGTWVLQDESARRASVAVGGRRTVPWRDVLRTSVGIKTTADGVFIRTREAWGALPPDRRPEPALLRSVRLTDDVARWALPPAAGLRSRVLYPFRDDCVRRTPVDLEDYPGATAYFADHRPRLEARRYVTDAGRHWYEPWVPHTPAAWRTPRLVCRDIAAEPVFAVDASAAIPNGTLYWSTPRADGGAEELLWAACAVANSRWCGEFYDLTLGTRLYAGRRRYNTQALDEFLLPGDDRTIRELAELARTAARATDAGRADDVRRVEAEVDRCCRRLFG